MNQAVSRLLKKYPNVDCIFDAYTLEELYVSDRILQALGFSKEELLGRYFFEGCPTEEDMRQQRELLYNAIVKEKPVEVKVRRKGKDRILEMAMRAQLEHVSDTPYGLCFIQKWGRV